MTTVDHKAAEQQRWRLLLIGDLQGVGFRPFIARLAKKYNLTGVVQNQTNGVGLEVQGRTSDLSLFNQELLQSYKMKESIQKCDLTLIATLEEASFKIIKDSLAKSIAQALPKDQATCNDCLCELFDSRNRRFHYPFISCARCGPRFSIIKQLPFEREFTSMDEFSLCPSCHGEYQSLEDRRYHAQTLSCKDCGPKLVLRNERGEQIAEYESAITHAVQVLLNGGLLAVKSTGGIQLCALALSELEPREFKLKRNPVDKLRKLKARGDKPFAVMMRDVAAISRICEVNVTERATLESLAAPIVLLEKKNPKDFIRISDNHLLGVMLPSQAIYHILMQELAQHGIDMCIVTSANPPGRPILSDSEQFILDMSGYFDAYLDHNREIIHPIEDSVVSVFQDKQIILRFGRGYAPGFIFNEDQARANEIAFGADLKANFALRLTKGIVLGPFISDLHTREQELAFEKSLDHFLGVYKLDPSNIFCDLHPQYVSRYLAQDYIKKNSSTLKKLIPVQHHYAHAASQFLTCPNEASLALVCDGLGFGYGNEIWGCELFRISKEKQLLRIASLSPYNLIGGDRASRDPGLCLLSLVRSIDLDEKIKKDLFNEFFDHNKISLINQYSKVDFASPLAAISIKCRSLGRLFDALAFLLANFKQLQSYEGQAALKLEHLAANAIEYEEFQVGKWSFSEGLWELQWQTFLIDLMLRHRQKHAEKDLAAIAAGFHHFLVDSFLSFAKQQGFKNIVLSGGVWQNRLLLRIICEKAGKVGIKVHLTPIMQVNDGAISLGQLFYKKIETRDSEK